MKVNDLKEFLNKHPKKDLELLIVELYKLIPNSKKEDYQVDNWIISPKEIKAKKQTIKTQSRDFEAIIEDVKLFSSNAKEQNYLLPNRIIAKKDRPKWRFVLINLYKEILQSEKNGIPKAACAAQLKTLYEVLTYSCHWQIFSAYDSFESVKIPQDEFFEKIIHLQRDSSDIKDFVENSIRLIIENDLNRYTLYSTLMNVFLRYCDTPALKELVIEKAIVLKEIIKNKPEDKRDTWSYWDKNGMSYEKMRKLNNLTELILMAYAGLFEYEKAVKFYQNNYIEKNDEVRLYILVSILFNLNLPSIIVMAIEKNIHVNPRQNLLILLEYIKKNGKLPKYLS
jgi:hypothetical protein